MSKKLHTVLASALILPSATIAGLDPISDEEMSEVTGQAFLSVDRNYHPDPSKNTAYTRVNLGMDIEIQTNVDVLEIGRYERDGEKSGTSDVLIENFGLGYINNQQRSEEHTSELQSRPQIVCRLLLETKRTKPRARTSMSAN